MKKIINFLFRWDGLWSAPILVLCFFAFSIVAPVFLGEGVSTYDPGIIQSIILCAAIVVAFNFLTWLGVRFNFSDWYHYSQTLLKLDILKLQPWQRIVILLGIYFFFFSSLLFILALVL